MNCCEYEDRIALYVEGDLGADEAAEVERHLADCRECSGFAGDLRESQAALKSLAQVVPGPEVRSRVLETLESRRRRTNWLAVAAALFVLLAAGLVWSVQQRMSVPQLALRPPQPPPVAEVPSPKPVEQAAALPKRPRLPVRTDPKPKPELMQLAQNTEPLVMTMFTDDPDVVIIWLVDGKEQQNEETTFGIDGRRGD